MCLVAPGDTIYPEDLGKDLSSVKKQEKRGEQGHAMCTVQHMCCVGITTLLHPRFPNTLS